MNSAPQTHTTQEDCDNSRGCGLTTRRAVEYLSKTLKTPGQPIDVRDHHNTLISHVRLAHTVSSLLRLLNVDHIVDGHFVTVRKLPKKGQAA